MFTVNKLYDNASHSTIANGICNVIKVILLLKDKGYPLAGVAQFMITEVGCAAVISN